MLVVVMGGFGNSHRLTQRRITAIRRQQQAGLDSAGLLLTLHLHADRLRFTLCRYDLRWRPERDVAACLQAPSQRLSQFPRDDYCTELIDRMLFGAQLDATEIARTTHIDTPNRLGRGAQMWKHLQALQRQQAAARQGEIALIEAGRCKAGRLLLDQTNRPAGTAQRDRQAAAHQPATHNDDIESRQLRFLHRSDPAYQFC